MKQIILFSLLLLAAIQVAGQALNVDSLVNVLNSQKLPVEEQFKLYKKVMENTGNSVILSECIKTGLPLAQKEKNKSMESTFNEYKGRIYVGKAMYDSAFYFFDKALKLAIESKDSKQESSVYTSYAVAYGFQSMYKELIESQLKALEIGEKLNDKQLVQASFGNIGSAYMSLNDSGHALEYQEKALALAEELNNTDKISKANYDLGAIKFNMGNYEQAEKHLLKALDLAKQIHGNQFMIGYILIALQELYSQGIIDLGKAEKYGKEALEIAEKLENPTLKANVYSGMSVIYRAQGRYKDCDIAATKAWELDSITLDMGISTMSNLTYANIQLSNKQKALESFDKYYALVNKFNDKSLHESLTSQEVKYETQKKEVRIASLEKERRMYVWLGIAGGLLVISLGIVLWQTLRNARKEKQLIAAKAVQEGEMGERARIAEDLHDRLGGSLSAVKIELNQAENLQNVSDKLDECIKEIRAITHNLMPRSLLSSGMKTALEDFAAQFPNVHFHFFGKEKRIRERLEFIIYCCANELVTNSIRYSGAKEINMQLIQGEKHVSLTVQDDGCGFDEKTVTAGIGLKNIRDRVASCNGKLDIASAPGQGTETVIELKIES